MDPLFVIALLLLVDGEWKAASDHWLGDGGAMPGTYCQPTTQVGDPPTYDPPYALVRYTGGATPSLFDGAPNVYVLPNVPLPTPLSEIDLDERQRLIAELEARQIDTRAIVWEVDTLSDILGLIVRKIDPAADVAAFLAG